MGWVSRLFDYGPDQLFDPVLTESIRRRGSEDPPWSSCPTLSTPSWPRRSSASSPTSSSAPSANRPSRPRRHNYRWVPILPTTGGWGRSFLRKRQMGTKRGSRSCRVWQRGGCWTWYNLRETWSGCGLLGGCATWERCRSGSTTKSPWSKRR